MAEPTVSSFHVAQKWINHPSKLPRVTDSHPTMCCCNHDNQQTTTYRCDFKEWNLSKYKPYKPHDNLKVFQGVSLEEHDKESEPIENRTSYRSSFIPHPVQPKKRLDKSRTQTSSIILGEPTNCVHCMSDSCPGKVPHIKSWTLDTKLPSFENGNMNRFLSTTHADYIPHTLQRRKPIKQTRQSSHRIVKSPFVGTTTMKDHYIEWELPRRPVTRLKDKKDWKKGFDQMSFSMCNGDNCHGNQKDKNADNGMIGFQYRRTKSDMDKPQAQMVRGMISTQS
ncbi:hypothetical protein NL108_005428 [Boleophthalmus pectinirostris]|nr:hypothetical protein NL108_005428 [Boleophthalmus pectinirostris]